MSIQKRKLSNFLLQPLLQIRLGLYSILLAFFLCCGVLAILYFSLRDFYSLVLTLTDLREDVEQILQPYIQSMTAWIMLTIAVYLFITVTVTIFFTHKLVGPTYAFRRHIRELGKGNFKSRVVLRKGDAFQEVAEDLNELALKLEQGRIGS